MQIYPLSCAYTYNRISSFQAGIKPQQTEIVTEEILPSLNKAIQTVEERCSFTFGPKVQPLGIFSKVEKFRTGIKDERLKRLEVEKWQNQIIYPEEGIIYPKEYTYVDMYGSIRLRPHLYIQGIQVKKPFRHMGVCKEIEHKIVEKSKESGCEGRVILYADYMNRDTAPIPPSIAHYKSGFRFPVEEQNIIMEQIIKGELPVEEAPLGFMFYPVA